MFQPFDVAEAYLLLNQTHLKPTVANNKPGSSRIKASQPSTKSMFLRISKAKTPEEFDF